MPAPLYDVLLVLHVAAAAGGFGAVAVSGDMARRARCARAPAAEERFVRFFKPGTNWPSHLVFLIAPLGLALLLGGDRGALGQPWPWIGLTLWALAVGILSGVGWPAERLAQRSLAADPGDATELVAFRAACARVELASAAAALAFLAAAALMVWQPS
jgi:hypothetical protein